MNAWSIRSLFNPVITRLLIYGVNPIDLEYVLSAVENKNHLNSKSLEQTWSKEWQKKAAVYTALAKKAEESNNAITAHTLYFYATQCFYAIFLINFSDISDKRDIYIKYSQLYKKVLEYAPFKTERMSIAIDDNNSIPGYLHIPNGAENKENPCVIIYTGLGSCKEEMITLAEPLIQRGIAVFISDMPGNGENIYNGKIICNYKNLQLAFNAIFDTLVQRSDIKKDAIGAYGLCMGGGYAYHAASNDSRYKACTTFFPLFISTIDQSTTPQWMKQGETFNLQTGDGNTAEHFLDDMAALENGALSCSFLFVHGKYDNWMTLEMAQVLYDKATGKKDKIIIEEAPVFSTQQIVTHTMPVGEQLHWLRIVAADWMVNELK